MQWGMVGSQKGSLSFSVLSSWVVYVIDGIVRGVFNIEEFVIIASFKELWQNIL